MQESNLEIWREIKEMPMYSVSNLGNIRSKYKDRLLSTFTKPTGYVAVGLFINNKPKQFLVHRLVATAWVDNPNGFNQVNHIDGDKTNNKKYNLEWCTGSQNMVHAYKNGLVPLPRGSAHHNSFLNENDVVRIKEFIQRGKLLKTIAAEFGVSSTTIGDIKHGRCWTHI